MTRPNFPMMGNIPNMMQQPNLHNQFQSMQMNMLQHPMQIMPQQIGFPGK
jgi:hypothetical protein